MKVILARSPFTLELIAPILTENIIPDNDQTGLYYDIDDSEVDKAFLPNECIIDIKEVSIEDLHKMFSSL